MEFVMTWSTLQDATLIRVIAAKLFQVLLLIATNAYVMVNLINF
jgi:hypothetical protein